MKLVITIDANATKREPIVVRLGVPAKASVAHVRMFPPPMPVKQPQEA